MPGKSKVEQGGATHPQPEELRRARYQQRLAPAQWLHPEGIRASGGRRAGLATLPPWHTSNWHRVADDVSCKPLSMPGREKMFPEAWSGPAQLTASISSQYLSEQRGWRPDVFLLLAQDEEGGGWLCSCRGTRHLGLAGSSLEGTWLFIVCFGCSVPTREASCRAGKQCAGKEGGPALLRSAERFASIPVGANTDSFHAKKKNSIYMYIHIQKSFKQLTPSMQDGPSSTSA